MVCNNILRRLVDSSTIVPAIPSIKILITMPTNRLITTDFSVLMKLKTKNITKINLLIKILVNFAFDSDEEEAEVVSQSQHLLMVD